MNVAIVRAGFPPSPVVLYVNEGGVHQCKVKSDGTEENRSSYLVVYANIGACEYY